MRMFSRMREGMSAAMQLLVRVVTIGLDALNTLVSRLYDRFDAGFTKRTQLLRARYARRTDLAVNPPPTVGGVANRAALMTGNDQQIAA